MRMLTIPMSRFVNLPLTRSQAQEFNILAHFIAVSHVLTALPRALLLLSLPHPPPLLHHSRPYSTFNVNMRNPLGVEALHELWILTQ